MDFPSTPGQIQEFYNLRVRDNHASTSPYKQRLAILYKEMPKRPCIVTLSVYRIRVPGECPGVI